MHSTTESRMRDRTLPTRPGELIVQPRAMALIEPVEMIEELLMAVGHGKPLPTPSSSALMVRPAAARSQPVRRVEIRAERLRSGWIDRRNCSWLNDIAAMGSGYPVDDGVAYRVSEVR
ncbi:hypothetical protein [Nocardia sp. NPDC004711]